MQAVLSNSSQKSVSALAATALVLVAAGAWNAAGPHLAAATLVGGLAGLALYHASFGFTSGWRNIITKKDGSGLRAQFVLILITCAFSFPLMAWGQNFGLPTHASVASFGLEAILGAFMFGLGMQLGSGCASGTLYTVGGGSTRMVVTLAAFVLGSILGAANLHQWRELPQIPAFSLVQSLGPIGAYLVTAVVLGIIALITLRIETRAHGKPIAFRATESLSQGPWSPVLGAVLLAVVSVLTLLILGRAWGVTSAFALWGGKIFQSIGIPVADWPYWAHQQAALSNSILHDPTSVMDIGIILGALIAAALAGKFAPIRKISLRDVVMGVLGGLLMGYGARLAHGCNIGAYLGGIISGSLHGWLWLVFAFIGSSLGTVVRRRTGMD